MSASTAAAVPCFSDEEVRAIAERPSAAIAAWVQSAARDLGIAVTPGPHDAYIKAVSRLSDGVIDLDPIEELLVALGRAGVLTPHQQVLLQLHYLRQMELQVLDPFGDYETAGYLRNSFREKDVRLVGRFESALQERHVLPTLLYLDSQSAVHYDHLLEVHRRIFSALYPWAGQDRSVTAHQIAIAKAGYKTLFAHPADVRRAAEYALQQAQDKPYLRAHPGEVFGQLAHAHPFLEGNGRTILTVYADLTRRAHFHIAWEQIDKDLFLKTLTDELLNPAKGTMDALVRSYLQEGSRPVDTAALNLRTNFKRG